MLSTSCTHQVGPAAARPATLQRLNRHGGVHSSTFAEARHISAARLGVLNPARMHCTGQDAQLDPVSSGRRSIAAAASPANAAQPGTAAAVQEEHEATKSSQETARVAQALVSKASSQQREGDAMANRQGLVQSCPALFLSLLLDHVHLPLGARCCFFIIAAAGARICQHHCICGMLQSCCVRMQALLVAAAGVWAAAHRDAMLMALRHISTPDVAAGLLVAAALLR